MRRLASVLARQKVEFPPFISVYDERFMLNGPLVGVYSSKDLSIREALCSSRSAAAFSRSVPFFYKTGAGIINLCVFHIKWLA